ncbi:putative B3 domain-containing protein REM15 isoform X2 [Salvia miltiorrhiza]|uniref:putative B3 domain-containing protein REM15 isoform X2 n=1 Tax=Salvia miltiorrhiza TaxID=226208 RepID=UPI0025AD295B|nr:putative B3 domain-containing protein REM15 isoform X2 [Salvia miltiorrhiza]
MPLGINIRERPFKSLHPHHHTFLCNSHFSLKPKGELHPPTSSPPATAKKVICKNEEEQKEKKSPNPMPRRSNDTPSFFKVLSSVDYIKLLRLPPHFLRKYELTLPENVKLRVDDSGRRWNVRVERMNDGLFCFTNGWEKFAEDAALKFGEFLVFSVVAKSELNVVIYETSCCKREIPLLQLNAQEEKKSPNPMSGRSNETPSFFKVLSNVDYIKLLRLPPHFLRKYELTLPANVKLRVDDSGRRWNVRVERMDDGLFCFTNGWEKFAEDAALKFGEFLVFSLLAKSEMNVDIYETSCCKREIPLLQLNAQDADESGVKRGIRVRPSSRKRGGKARKRNCFMKEGNPLYFATYLRPYHRWTISLPRAFSRAANMKVKKQVRVKYVGKRRGLCVALSHRPPRPTIDLAKGWREFREANGLVVGKIYSFEFNPDDQVIYVNRVAS